MAAAAGLTVVSQGNGLPDVFDSVGIEGRTPYTTVEVRAAFPDGPSSPNFEGLFVSGAGLVMSSRHPGNPRRHGHEVAASIIDAMTASNFSPPGIFPCPCPPPVCPCPPGWPWPCRDSAANAGQSALRHQWQVNDRLERPLALGINCDRTRCDPVPVAAKSPAPFEMRIPVVGVANWFKGPADPEERLDGESAVELIKSIMDGL